MNELHKAGRVGSVERTVAVLARGVIDIDEETPDGDTPLMMAAYFGHSRVVQILLNKGANVSIANDDGWTALHVSARRGHLAVTKLLVKADADLKSKTSTTGCTPLQLAAEKGHSEIMRVLIEAGANPNSRTLDSSTPLQVAAQSGHVDAVKVLVRAKANPLLTFTGLSGDTYVPLDAAAANGHVEVARELIQKLGIEGCGGASGGVDALEVAAGNQQVEIMELLTSAGVVDPGIALIAAAARGREFSVNHLLRQYERRASGGEGAGYLNTRNHYGVTPLYCSIGTCGPCSPRITRALLDAGVDTTTAFPLTDAGGVVYDTPLTLAEVYLRDKMINGKEATQSQLHSLEATRRMLMSMEAVYAVSWLWASDVPCVIHADAEGTATASEATPSPLISMLPILRRRARRPRVLLAALFRHSGKPY